MTAVGRRFDAFDLWGSDMKQLVLCLLAMSASSPLLAQDNPRPSQPVSYTHLTLPTILLV